MRRIDIFPIKISLLLSALIVVTYRVVNCEMVIGIILHNACNSNHLKSRKNYLGKMSNVHSNKGDIVLLSKNEYDSLVETIKLLSIPGFRESLKKSVEQMNRGDTFAFEEIFGGE